ncbi:hypothetical protein BC827DRAFT_804317 [Russula dissimulans]|nr:hypothetical protein BC827DRAFT_804317 [Russula dissimulans]
MSRTGILLTGFGIVSRGLLDRSFLSRLSYEYRIRVHAVPDGFRYRGNVVGAYFLYVLGTYHTVKSHQRDPRMQWSNGLECTTCPRSRLVQVPWPTSLSHLSSLFDGERGHRRF